MKFSVKQKDLLKCLSDVQSVVEKRNSIPILANIKLEAISSKIIITATDLEAFSGFSAVYLEDKVAGKLINLKETPSYTVKLSEGNSGDRFQLRFTNISENNANVSTSNQLNIFASDSRVFVNIPQEGNSRIEVMNILGQNLVTVDATSFKGLKEVSIPNVVAGSYLVKVTNGGKVYTQKVVLTNKQ